MDTSGGDAMLVRRVAARDPDALGELYDRYGRVVHAIAYRMLGTPDAAEEVTQDVFHAVWVRIGSYREDRGTFRGWLLAIARNAAVDRRRRSGYVGRETPMDAAPDMRDDASVDDQVAVRIRDGRVRAVVGSLPAEQRQVLDLAFWGGLSQSEISARTGVPLGTVKSRVRLAMAKLRDGLAEEARER